MKLFPLAAFAAIFLALGTPVEAAKRSGIGTFSGSYTGNCVAKSAGSTLSGSTTLTFTGKKTSLSGTFLYNGWLNQSGALVKVDQTFRIGRKGALAGYAIVGDRRASGTGKVSLSKKTLKFSITYKLNGPVPTSIQLVGKVVFTRKSASMAAKVSSPDGSFNGSVKARGTR